MSKPTTHVLLVVDKSGSMAHLAKDVCGGFNSYVDDLRADTDGRYRLTVALFDTRYDLIANAAELKDVPVLDSTTYKPRGMTALLDAIGKTITDFEATVPELGDGDRVLLVVQTDGEENSSREFATDAIRRLITDREAGGRWSCIFLGAGIDAWSTSRDLGFDHGSTISVDNSSHGTRSTYSGITRATQAFSRGASGAVVSGLIADEAGVDG